MEWIGFGFDLDLIWIEIGVFKNFKECARSPCNGNHCSSVIGERTKRERRYLVMFMEVRDIYMRTSVSNTHVRVECFAN